MEYGKHFLLVYEVNRQNSDPDIASLKNGQTKAI